MNIGIVIGSLPSGPVGGMEFQAFNLAINLKDEHNIKIFTLNHNGEPRLENKDGILIIRRKFGNFFVIRTILQIVFGILDIYRYRHKLDILICYNFKFNGFIGALSKLLFQIPFIIWIRGDGSYVNKFSETFLNKYIAPYTLKKANSIFVQSKKIKNDLLSEIKKTGRQLLFQEAKSKIIVLPNGINVSKITKNNGNHVIYVGRLAKEKGVDSLLAAIRLMKNVNVIIVGDGPEKEKLQILAKDLPVNFTGHVPPIKVNNFLTQSKVLVLPSLRDGMPNVILEAMLHGVPSIASNIGGIPDIIEHGKTGFLFEPANSDQIVFYLNKLLNDNILYKQLSDNCILEIQKYSWENIIPQLEKHLMEIIKKHKKN